MDEVIGYMPPETTPIRPFRTDDRVMRSEIPGVTNEGWTDFVFVMKTGKLGDVSLSNGLGLFDTRYKRLADLGLVTNVSYKRDPVINRSVQVADWVPKLSKEIFLKSASLQYRVFSESMRRYAAAVRDGKLDLPEGGVPKEMTLSGMLAILHRGGPSALKKWGDEKFEQTAELYRQANGVF